MRIGGVQLNSFQANVIKDLLGEPSMTDIRAEDMFTSKCKRHGIDVVAVLEAINKNYAVKQVEFEKTKADWS